MGLDWAAITRFVPEVVLAVIFGLFVLRLLERQDKRDSERDDAFIQALDRRDGEWRGYMSDDRERLSAALGRVAEEVKSLANAVSVTHTLIAQHDQWARLEAARQEKEKK